MDSLTARVRTAEGDAWRVHGALRAGVRELRGIRLMASGLDQPRWSNGDVTAPMRTSTRLGFVEVPGFNVFVNQ